MNTEIKEVTVRGEKRYSLDLRVDARRVRKFFKTKADAERFMKEEDREKNSFGSEWIKFTEDERYTLARIMVQ
ncbi:MAG TPA: hypothetical protein VGR78_00415, partial [Verrucomicrobiae bacterium]|nr:hypothetical protein [Verrucomicrobiae bacterium]